MTAVSLMPAVSLMSAVMLISPPTQIQHIGCCIQNALGGCPGRPGGPAGLPGSTVGSGSRAATQLPLSMRMKDDTGMTSRVQGVIARSKGEPVEVTTVLVPDPGPGEALVAVQACGVCHTDLHYREGGIGDDFPYLLGH